MVLGFLRPLDEPMALTHAVVQHLTTFAVELIPRITRAQAMDALSSMATVVGYKAVLLGASQIHDCFHADDGCWDSGAGAGSCLVRGYRLQAIATARVWALSGL